jgi:nucleoside recognition membrane protein YjiH
MSVFDRTTAPVRPATEVTALAGALARTKAVVAICVVFVPSVAVGAVGVPVSAGEAKGA